MQHVIDAGYLLSAGEMNTVNDQLIEYGLRIHEGVTVNLIKHGLQPCGEIEYRGGGARILVYSGEVGRPLRELTSRLGWMYEGPRTHFHGSGPDAIECRDEP